MPSFLSRQRRAVLADFGGLLLVPGALAVTALAVAALAGEWGVMPGLGITLVLSAALGFGLRSLHRGHTLEGDVRAPLGTLAVALGWVGASLLAALPFYLVDLGGGPLAPTSLVFGSFWNAFFESLSGLTGTGLTVAPDPSELPHALQWWRSVLQWAGGLGVVLVALTFFESHSSRASLASLDLNVPESAVRRQRPVRQLWAVYAWLTLGSVVLFWLAGMPPWEALNHGITGIATGGFSVTADSFQSYGALVKASGVLIMVVGGIDFAVHARVVFRREIGAWARDSQTRAMGALLAGGALLLVGVTLARGDSGTALDAAFLWASVVSTSGFTSVDLSGWSAAARFLLLPAMFVGAAAGSTGGGIKIRRAMLALTSVFWRLRARDDRTTLRHRHAGESLSESAILAQLEKASALLVASLVALITGTLALMLLVGDAYEPLALLFEAASALGNVGLTSGVVSAELAAPAKAVLMTLMWLGRLEVVAALMIVVEIVVARRAPEAGREAASGEHVEEAR